MTKIVNEKTVKIPVSVNWNDAERLHAARAGVDLHHRYVISLRLDNPLLVGINQLEEGQLSYAGMECLREALRANLAADHAAAVAAATAKYEAALAEKHAKAAAEVEQQKAAELRKKKLAEASELLAEKLACMSEEIARLRVQRAKLEARLEHVQKLLLFVRENKLEEAYYKFTDEKYKPTAAERFSAEFA